MAIKIINEVPDPSVLKRVICKRCGIELEYLPVDVLSKTLHHFGDVDVVSYIPCPKCGNQITVK